MIRKIKRKEWSKRERKKREIKRPNSGFDGLSEKKKGIYKYVYVVI